MKIFVSVLGAFGVTSETLRVLWDAQKTNPEIEWEISPHYLQACIDRTRGQVLADFLDNSTADVLLNLDDDVWVESGGLKYIAEQALVLNALVGPITSKRALNKGYACRLPKGTNVVLGDPTPIKLEIGDWVGGTCFAAPRAVIEALDTMRTLDGWIPAHLPFVRRMTLQDGHLVPDPNGKYLEYVSEDAALTWRVQQLGFDAYLLPKILTKHIGKFAFEPLHAVPQQRDNITRFYSPYIDGSALFVGSTPIAKTSSAPVITETVVAPKEDK